MGTVNNNIRNFSFFDQISLPFGWQEKSAPHGRGDSFLRAFSPVDREDVEIAIFSDGKNLDSEARDVFRTALLSIPRTVYDTEPKLEGLNDEPLAMRLSAVMGNAGGNQLTASGMDWRVFHLETLEITAVSESMCLHFTGFFHNKAGEPVSFYDSYLFDGTPQAETCRVDELYFKAPDAESFVRYKQQFGATVRSIVTPAKAQSF